MRAAADPRLRPRRHWDLLAIGIYRLSEERVKEVFVQLNDSNVKENAIFKLANSEEKLNVNTESYQAFETIE
jgi:hypothetical protein